VSQEQKLQQQLEREKAAQAAKEAKRVAKEEAARQKEHVRYHIDLSCIKHISIVLYLQFALSHGDWPFCCILFSQNFPKMTQF
jgi:hypothetical protein